jgi:hypothetical protein
LKGEEPPVEIVARPASSPCGFCPPHTERTCPVEKFAALARLLLVKVAD